MSHKTLDDIKDHWERTRREATHGAADTAQPADPKPEPKGDKPAIDDKPEVKPVPPKVDPPRVEPHKPLGDKVG